MFNSETVALTKECIREVVRVNGKVTSLERDISAMKTQIGSDIKTTCLSGVMMSDDFTSKSIVDRLNSIDCSLALIKKKLKIKEKKIF